MVMACLGLGCREGHRQEDESHRPKGMRNGPHPRAGWEGNTWVPAWRTGMLETAKGWVLGATVPRGRFREEKQGAG